MLARRMRQHDLQECKPRPMLSVEANYAVGSRYLYIKRAKLSVLILIPCGMIVISSGYDQIRLTFRSKMVSLGGIPLQVIPESKTCFFIGCT